MQRHVKDHHAEAIAAAENAQTSFACDVCPGLTWDTKKEHELDAHCQCLRIHYSFTSRGSHHGSNHRNTDSSRQTLRNGSKKLREWVEHVQEGWSRMDRYATSQEIRRDIGRRPEIRDITTVSIDVIWAWVEEMGIQLGDGCESGEQREKAARLVYTYRDVFAVELADIKTTDLIQHTMSMCGRSWKICAKFGWKSAWHGISSSKEDRKVALNMALIRLAQFVAQDIHGLSMLMSDTILANQPLRRP
ncbi:hypothetical protein NEUTE2DRAFT_125110 [Neurospora tetrasperma FGSC 2509]|nr:hypothetical protein NEUTE2DRAFT_125110 [Neurospora tetrasperma FGSC 2509]